MENPKQISVILPILVSRIFLVYSFAKPVIPKRFRFCLAIPASPLFLERAKPDLLPFHSCPGSSPLAGVLENWHLLKMFKVVSDLLLEIVKHL